MLFLILLPLLVLLRLVVSIGRDSHQLPLQHIHHHQHDLQAGFPHSQLAPSHSLLSTETRDYIESMRKKWGGPGLSIAIVASPEWLNETGRGSATGADQGWHMETLAFGSMNTAGDPVHANSRFGIASNSKLFNALTVGLLIENKTVLPNGQLLDWSTKAKDALPDWKLSDPYASDHVDITDLLSMRSGMPRHDNSGNFDIPNLRNLKMSTEIRQDFQYCNLHYHALASLVPHLTGQRYIDWVDEHIFQPLGMTQTTYNATIARASGNLSESFAPVGYDIQKCRESWKEGKLDWEACRGERKGFEWWADTDRTYIAGEGGVISTASDLIKWLQELLSPTIIPPQLITKVTTANGFAFPSIPYPEISTSGYGFGQLTYTYRGARIDGHTGSLPGQISSIYRHPGKFGVAVLVNDDWILDNFRVLVERRVFDELLGLKPVDWDERFVKHVATEKQNYTKVPKSPNQPERGFDAIPGEFTNPGYAQLSLRRVTIPKNTSTIPEILNGSIPFESGLNLTGPTFAAYIGAPFMTHLVFTHFDGNYFNWTGLEIHPATKGGDIALMRGLGSAIIDDEGVGMFGNFWGAGDTVPIRHAQEGKDRAEVWYDRL